MREVMVYGLCVGEGILFVVLMMLYRRVGKVLDGRKVREKMRDLRLKLFGG